MKNLRMEAAVIALVLFTSTARGQQGENKLHGAESYNLEISDTKTSNVIFPFAIVSVDRGSQDILVQKAKGVENILQVKAANAELEESNLSVVTADGKLTTFNISYSADPSSLNLSLYPNAVNGDNSIFSPKENINEAEVREDVETVLYSNRYRPGIKSHKNDISLYLKGIFIKENILYFRISIANWSNVGYDIEQLRFSIRDKKQAKRTASQEIEVVPIFVNKTPEKVGGKSINIYVFAVPKFTIPDQKYLAVQLMEQNGGRHVALKVKNRHILGALVIK